VKICLVTAFPPSRGGLSEYGFHIACELTKNPLISLTILADELSAEQPELEGFSVLRCWSSDNPKSLTGLWGTIRRLDPDVVWFNLIFSTFGRKPMPAFCGLVLPLLTRLSGFYTHVTLHHLMERIDLKDAGVRFPRLYRSAGALATRILLKSSSVSVLVPAYRKLLIEKYGSQNVHVRSHGILSRHPERPDFSRRGNPFQKILAFGKWGTYKKLEPIFEAFNIVSGRLPNTKLIIAGGDHPSTPGYVASMAKRCESESRIEFIGYVQEKAIPDLFQSASIAVMAYSSATGSSGVAHIACTYGVPIISADIADFRGMADEEGMAMEFYEAGNSLDLASRLIALLESPERQVEMAEQNFSAASSMTMPQITYRYLRHFDLEQKTKTLKSIARLRKARRWSLASAFLNISTAWRVTPPRHWDSLFQSGPTDHASASVDGHGFWSGRVYASRQGIDLDGVGTVTEVDGHDLAWRRIVSERTERDKHAVKGTNLENPVQPLASEVVGHKLRLSTNGSKANGKHPGLRPAGLRREETSNGNDRNRENGVRRSKVGADVGTQEVVSLTREETGPKAKDQVVQQSGLLQGNSDMDAA
jgi:glycosyltransferase involved in cell wall biosynthesis